MGRRSHCLFFFLFLITFSNARTTRPDPSSARRRLGLGATSAPLSTNIIGAYTVALSFGTPPQNMTFVMDTGSNFVWFPCTEDYICDNCSSLLPSPSSKIPKFIPAESSSSKLVACGSPKCSWLHHKASVCEEGGDRCSAYFIQYATGDTSGLPLVDTLRLKDLTVPEFLVGCSTITTGQPTGIAGLGRGPSSLPTQLNLTKFSYCSFSFNSLSNKPSGNTILLDYSHQSGKKTAGMTYTPFVKNPNVEGNPAYLAYYYVTLRRISLGNKRVKIPYKYLAPDDQGNGGTVMDSGSSFTFLPRGVFDLLSNELLAQMAAKGYRRNLGAEIENNLSPCFDFPMNDLSFPHLRLQFKGGMALRLGMGNFMAPVGNGTSTACFAVITDDGGDLEGPGIILGNFQFQNYYIEYDLENERLGFRKQKCRVK